MKLNGIQLQMPICAASLIRTVCGLLASTTTDVRQIYQERPISIKRDLYQSKKTYINQKRPVSIKRDLYQSKETYINQKRPISIKRDLYQSKETYINQKRPISIKRDLYQSKETYINQKRPISPTIEVRRVCQKRHISIKGETCINQIRPISTKRDLYKLKETYINQQRPISIKRELYLSKDQKETYFNEKRPISIKRELYQSKDQEETYINEKKDPEETCSQFKQCVVPVRRQDCKTEICKCTKETYTRHRHMKQSWIKIAPNRLCVRIHPLRAWKLLSCFLVIKHQHMQQQDWRTI